LRNSIENVAKFGSFGFKEAVSNELRPRLDDEEKISTPRKGKERSERETRPNIVLNFLRKRKNGTKFTSPHPNLPWERFKPELIPQSCKGQSYYDDQILFRAYEAKISEVKYNQDPRNVKKEFFFFSEGKY